MAVETSFEHVFTTGVNRLSLRTDLGLLTWERELTLFEATTISVQREFPVSFVSRSPVDVICLSGIAWITTERSICDVVLVAGQIYAAVRGDRLFINGMPECLLRIGPVVTSA